MSTPHSPSECQIWAARDGARLAYARYGDPGGKPLLFFHGWPGSRLQGAMVDAAGKEHGWQVVAVDRPGIGFTRTPEPFSLPAWPHRIEELLDHLDWQRCHLFAISGGAPSALACAHTIPSRFHAMGIACGAVSFAEAPSLDGLFPLFHFLLKLDHRLSPLSPALLRLMALYLKMMPPALATMPNRWLLPRPDRRIFADPDARAMLGISLREAYRQGPYGVLHDGRAIAAPWGFDWRAAAKGVPIRFWHGDEDGTIPLPFAQWATEEMGLADQLKILPGEGHFSLPIGRSGELLRELKDMNA